MILRLFFEYFFDVVDAFDAFGADAAPDIIIVVDDVSKTVVAAAVWYA
jgi:hypothetical protein